MRPLAGVTLSAGPCRSRMHQHQSGSSSHCPFLHLIHEHYPTVVGHFTRTISISLLQTLSEPEASKTFWAGGPEQELGKMPGAGGMGKFGRSKMVPTGLCTKSCPGTGCSLLSPPLQRHRSSAGALTRAELAGEAGRESLAQIQDKNTNPWVYCRWKEGCVRVCEKWGGLLQNPGSAIQSLVDLTGCSHGHQFL